MTSPLPSSDHHSPVSRLGPALELLFDRLPMGLAVFDRDLRLLRSNPAWAAMLGSAAPGRHFFELSPGSQDTFAPILARVLAGETVQSEAVRIQKQGEVAYWDRTLAPVVEAGQILAILDLVVDVTARVLAEQERQAAFARLKENEAAQRSIIENARHFAIYRVAYDPENPYGGELVFVSPSLADITGIADPSRFENWFQGIHPEDQERVLEANRRAMELGQPYNQTARVFHPGKQRWVFVHTISNPAFDAQGRLTHFDGMVIDLTDQLNLQEAERLRRAAEGLRDIIAIINSNRSLQETLDYIAWQASQLLQANSTMIRSVSLDEETVTTVAAYNLPPEFERIRVQPFYRMHSDQALLSRRPVTMTDIPAVYLPRLADPNFTDELQRAGLEATVKYYQSLLKVPLFIKDEIFGALTFHFEQPRTFSEEDLRLAMTLADQAALAIENAHLIDRVKETAILEERSRLARELHDAVTQTLFSTTLTAEVLPRIWEKDPVEGRKRLDELRELTRGALAEMRTLLIELRPAALADAELKDLLRHLTNAFIARARVPVQLEFNGECSIPLEVKVVFYRIAQEALNNIAKHAEASQVWVTLNCRAQSVALSVVDNGQGFDVELARPDHFGLGIMRERAAQIGASIEIHSQAEHGTRIQIFWQAAETGS